MGWGGKGIVRVSERVRNTYILQLLLPPLTNSPRETINSVIPARARGSVVESTSADDSKVFLNN